MAVALCATFSDMVFLCWFVPINNPRSRRNSQPMHKAPLWEYHAYHFRNWNSKPACSATQRQGLSVINRGLLANLEFVHT